MDEYLISTIIILSILFGWSLLAIQRVSSDPNGQQRRSLYGLLSILFCWIVFICYLSLNNFYLTTKRSSIFANVSQLCRYHLSLWIGAGL